MEYKIATKTLVVGKVISFYYYTFSTCPGKHNLLTITLKSIVLLEHNFERIHGFEIN